MKETGKTKDIKLLELSDFPVNDNKLDARDRQIEELQKKLQETENLWNEEKVFFVLIVVILLDVIFFQLMSSSWGIIGILILEISGLLAYAESKKAKCLNKHFYKIAKLATTTYREVTSKFKKAA